MRTGWFTRQAGQLTITMFARGNPTNMHEMREQEEQEHAVMWGCWKWDIDLDIMGLGHVGCCRFATESSEEILSGLQDYKGSLNYAIYFTNCLPITIELL